MAFGQCLRNGFGCDAGPAQARQGHFDAAFLCVTRTLVNGATANVVAVFCQIRQMAEVGEGTNHAHGLVSREAFEQFFQRFVCRVVFVTSECNRQFAYVFNQIEGIFTLLLANHIAQNATQQTNVLNQGAFIGLLLGQRLRFGAGFDWVGRRV